MNRQRREWLIDRALPRYCVARHVSSFDDDDVIDRLYRKRQIESDFRIVSQVARPTHESSFDVCVDAANLYLSVLFWDEYEAASAVSAVVEGCDDNVVEILLAPFDDEVGFLQFGTGPGTQQWYDHHWPYRDGRRNFALRPQWEVTHHVDVMVETVARFALFRFSLSSVIDADHCGPIGLNVMRTHLGTGESATWSYASGSGFPDATGMGQLMLDDRAVPPTPRLTPPTPTDRFQLQATYDFPDEMVNGPYTCETLRWEFQRLREAGVSRIYWLDNPFLARHVHMSTDFNGTSATSSSRDFAIRTLEAMNGDPMPVAAKLAGEMDLEFYTVIKPYDLWCRSTQPVTDPPDAECPRALGGHATTPDIFVATHPDLAMRRNPAWMSDDSPGALTDITLFADNDAPPPFDPTNIELYHSRDNVTYDRCDTVQVTQRVIDRPCFAWTPAGKHRTNGHQRVRCIELTGTNLEGGYLAVRLPPASRPGVFGNQLYLLAEVMSGATVIPITMDTMRRSNDFRSGGFEFGIHSNSATWNDQTEEIERRRNLSSGDILGIAIGQDRYKIGMLEPGFAAVRDYWLTHYVRRAIDAGVDGVDVRIAHHHGCLEWLSYAWADPVLDAFRRLTGRDPMPTADDYEQARRIRGRFHTQFLRDAKAMLQAAGMKLEHHVESRMTTPPQHDTYTQIHWDCATWIDEGIVDGINLKYLGPFNPWVSREILPRANARGVPVHMIAAVGDPRRQPRTPEWTLEMVDLAQCGGLKGLNLYEVWLYLRSIPRGHPCLRGCTASIFEKLSQHHLLK